MNRADGIRERLETLRAERARHGGPCPECGYGGPPFSPPGHFADCQTGARATAADQHLLDDLAWLLDTHVEPAPGMRDPLAEHLAREHTRPGDELAWASWTCGYDADAHELHVDWPTIASLALGWIRDHPARLREAGR